MCAALEASFKKKRSPFVARWVPETTQISVCGNDVLRKLSGASHRNPRGATISSHRISRVLQHLMAKAHQPNNDMLRGTLDMMVLRTLLSGDAHGHTIAKIIERTSDDVLEVEQGSL